MSDLAYALKLDATDLSDRELIIAIGENDPDSLAFDEASDDQKYDAGNLWWSKRSQEIRDIVCEVTKDKDLLKSGSSDIVALIFGILGAKYGMAIAAYLAVIAARRALSGWCGQLHA